MFDQAFIEATREAQGDEAADQLLQANAKEAHQTRLARYATDPQYAERYPRMVNGLKNQLVQIPVVGDDAMAEAYLQQQEETLKAMGVPDPRQPAQQPQPGNQPAPPEYGTKPGLVPWTEGATQSMSLGIGPGPSPDQAQVAASRVEDLMEPQDGEFRTGRARDRALIKEMEAANRMDGGSSAMFDVSRRHESVNVFPV
jgi:hypothetical protein